MARTKKNNEKITHKINKIHNKEIKKNKTRKYNLSNQNEKQYFNFKTQKGGGFSFKHFMKMNKFNKLIKNLQKEEINIKKELGSYKANANIFKNLAENKRDKTTNYVLNKRQQKILDFVKLKNNDANTKHNNRLDELQYQHDIELSKSKDSEIDINIKQVNKDILKKIPEFIKDKNKLEKNSKKFRELVDKITSGDIGNFQAKIKILKKEYDEILPQSKKTLKSIHKKVLKKYLSHKADYEKVIKLDETYIQKQQALVHEIFDLLKQGQFYIEQIEALDTKKEGLDQNLIIWDEYYTKIYELLDNIINSIKNTKKKIEEILNLESEIDIAIHPIAQNTSDTIIKRSSEEIKKTKKDFEKVINYLDASALSINEILKMLLNEKMASQITDDTLKIASAFVGVIERLKKYKNIFTPISRNMQNGGSGDDLDFYNDLDNDNDYNENGILKPTLHKSATKSVTIKTNKPDKTLNPICFKKDSPEFKNINGNDKTLFIYNTSFNNYINSNIDSDIDKYRKDVDGTDPKKKALGIPIDFDDGNTIDETIDDIDFNTEINNSPNFTKITSPNTDKLDNKDIIKEYLIQAYKNILSYIKNSGIKKIYYYASCDKDKKLKNDIYSLFPKINSKFGQKNKNLFEKLAKDFIKTLKTAPFNFQRENASLTEEAADLALAFTTPVGTPQTPAGTQQTPAGTPQTPALSQVGKTQIPLQFYSISTDNYLIDPNTNTKINVNRIPNNSIYQDQNYNIIDNSFINRTFILKGLKAKVTSDGNIYFDPSLSENNPLRSIILTMEQNKENKYDNNIKIISENSNKISDIISSLIDPKSDFMMLTEKVQELSQVLFKLSKIEPKVINVELDKIKPIAKQYSWILKPVELNKTEFHSLAGTETLDKLVKEDKAASEFYKKSTSVPDTDIDNFIVLLASNPSNFTYENKQKLNNIIQNNYSNFISKVNSKYVNDNISKCAIYSIIQRNINPLPTASIETEINNGKKTYCGNKKDKYDNGGRSKNDRGRGGKSGRGRGRSYKYN